MRALLSVANREGICRTGPRPAGLGVEIFATDGTREHLAADGIEVASVVGPDGRRADGRRPGQDVPPRDLRRDPRPARRAGADGRAGGAGHRPDRPRRRQRQAVRAGRGRQARRPRRSHRDDRCRRRGAPRRRRAQLRRRRGRLGPVALRTDHRRAARARPGQAPRRGHSWRPRRSARSPRTTPRSRPTSTRSRGNTFPNRLALVLEKVADLRYGENPHQRGAFYRETTHRSGTLGRRDARSRASDRPSTT